MRLVDQLLAEFCPTGVLYKAIGEVGRLVRGNGMPKSDFTASGVGCIHYGQIYTSYGTSATKTFSFISPEKAKRLAKVDPGDIVITNTSENVEDVCKAVAWLGAKQVVTGGHATVLKHNEDPKFLAYYFQTENFFIEKRKLATGTKVIDVSSKNLSKIRIPIPPIEVQRAIVKVLDNFSDLEAKLEAQLEAEIDARRHQYLHYRNTLLDPGDQNTVRWKELSDIFDMQAGQHASASRIARVRTNTHRYPCYGGNGVRGYMEDYSQDGAHLLIGRQGALCGNVQRVRGKYYATEHAVVTIPNDEEVNVDWAFHMLTAMNLNQHATKSAQPGLAVGRLATLKIPLPPLSEQLRVARILDRLDALTRDLSTVLASELKARRQQYAYYRDRLLTLRGAG